jgi:acetyltransferase-like isoleucine patch superfamily enzyme
MKIVVFGANSDAHNFLKQIESLSFISQIEIVAIVDNDSRLHNTFLYGYQILDPEIIKTLSYDKVIVCPIFYDEIIEQLEGYGIDPIKIHRIHSEKFFSKNQRDIKDSVIGKYSYYKANTMLINCVIGNYCHIGDNCIIGQSGHRIDLPTTYPMHYHFNNEIIDVRFDKTKDERRVNSKTVIGHDVYIGESVVIQGGVKIGSGSVIASRSVVTKDVDPYTVVGGIPAKKLKMRFSDEIIENLLRLEWWHYDDVTIERNLHSFTLDIHKFLQHWSVNDLE